MKRATARPRAWWRDPVLLGLLALALGLRLWYLSIHNHRSAFFADEGDYYARAINLAFGSGYVDDFWLIRPPLVVFWLAGLFKATALAGLGAHLLLVARLAQVGLSLAVLVLLYDTGRALYGVSAGRWAAGGWAVLYSFVKLPALLLVENIFLALVTVFFWALARYECRPAAASGRRAWGWLALAGLALGLATLARSTLIWFLPVVGLWLWLIERKRRPGARVNPLAIAGRWLAVAGVMAAVVSPWTLRNYRLYGSFIPVDTMLGANLWLDADELDSRRGDNPKLAALQAIGDPVARDAYGRQQGLAAIAADPGAKLARSWAQVRHALRLEFLANFFDRSSLDSEPLRRAWPLAAPSDLLTLGLVLLLVWSAFNPAIAGPFKLGALLWVGLNLAAIVVFHSETRYLLPIYHVALLLGGGSIARAQTLVAGWRLLGSMAAMFAIILVVMTYKPYATLLDRGLDREFALADGWAAYREGDWVLAGGAARRAQQADPDFNEPLWLEALAAAAGEGPEAGLAPINAAIARDSRDAHARLIRLDLLRRLGRLAEVADAQGLESAAPADLLGWSFETLRSPPQTALALDSRADLGFVRGWWPADGGRGAGRRASGRAEFRLLVPTNRTPQLMIRAYLPGTVAEGPVRVLADGVEVAVFMPSRSWGDHQILLPAALSGQEVTFALIGPTALEAGGAPGTDMLRVAGLEVARVATE